METKIDTLQQIFKLLHQQSNTTGSDLILNLAASFIALLIGLFWQDKFLPWLQSLLYHGIKINGKWEIIQEMTGTVEGKELSIKRQIYVDLNQKAFTLTGSATSIADLADGKKDFVVYDVYGEIKDRFVTIHFKVNDKSKIAYSSFLLEVVADGKTMNGYRVFYGFRRKEVQAIKCLWKKTDK